MNIHSTSYQPLPQPTGLGLCRRPSGRSIGELRDKIREQTGKKPPKDNDAVVDLARKLGIPTPGMLIGEG